MPHRVSANSEISVIDEISNNNRASNFEPAIRIILKHLCWSLPVSQKMIHTCSNARKSISYDIRIDRIWEILAMETKSSDQLLDIFK